MKYLAPFLAACALALAAAPVATAAAPSSSPPVSVQSGGPIDPGLSIWVQKVHGHRMSDKAHRCLVGAAIATAGVIPPAIIAEAAARVIVASSLSAGITTCISIIANS